MQRHVFYGMLLTALMFRVHRIEPKISNTLFTIMLYIYDRIWLEVFSIKLCDFIFLILLNFNTRWEGYSDHRRRITTKQWYINFYWIKFLEVFYGLYYQLKVEV